MLEMKYIVLQNWLQKAVRFGQEAGGTLWIPHAL